LVYGGSPEVSRVPHGTSPVDRRAKAAVFLFFKEYLMTTYLSYWFTLFYFFWFGSGSG